MNMNTLRDKTNTVLDSLFKPKYGYIADIIEFCRKHKVLVWTLIFVSVAAFGYEVCNFSVSPDEEREIVRAAGTNYDITKLTLNEGRYISWLTKQLLTLDGIFTPAVETFMAVVFSALSAIIICMVIQCAAGEKEVRESAFIAFSVLYLTYPCVVADLMSYDICNDLDALTRVLLALAQYDIIRYEKYKHKPLLIRAILMSAMLFTTELPITMFVMTSAMLVFYRVLYSERVDFVQIVSLTLKFILVFLVSVCVVYGLKLFVIMGNGYQSQFIKWNFSEPLGPQIKGVVAACWDYLTNSRWLGNDGLLLGSILAAAAVLVCAVKSKSIKGVYLIVLFALVYFFAFSMVWICGGTMPIRTMVTLPFLSGFVWSIASECIASSKRLSTLVLICALYIGFRQVLYLNRAFTGSHLCSELDMEMGYKIGTDVQAEAGARNPSKPVVFVGRYQHPASNIYRIDASGQSIFFRNHTQYKVFYLNYLGFDFKHANNQQIEQAEELSKTQPAYPLDGYVQEYEEIIVVKLNGTTSASVSVKPLDYLADTEKEKLYALPSKEIQKGSSFGWIGEDGIYLYCQGTPENADRTFSVASNASSVELRGWAADFMVGDALEDLYICVGDKIIQCDYGIDRGDVAEHFKDDDLRFVGFSIIIPITDFDFDRDGSAQISFLMVGADGNYYYPTDEYSIIKAEK